jgi:hypothetical protein
VALSDTVVCEWYCGLWVILWSVSDELQRIWREVRACFSTLAPEGVCIHAGMMRKSIDRYSCRAFTRRVMGGIFKPCSFTEYTGHWILATKSLRCGARIAQSVWRLITGWTVRWSNPGGGEIFCTGPDRPWGPPSLLYNGTGSFPGVKRPERDADHSPPSSAEITKE